MRLDHWLVHHQKVRSRSQAEELIKRGDVAILDSKSFEWKKILKPSYLVADNFNPEHLKIESTLAGYVARSGYKLERALSTLNLNVKGLKCLDVGQSTGGFSQTLLEAGAQIVVGLDVGKGQLNPDLLKYPNLISFENLDIRRANESNDFLSYCPFDLAVIDVSFISLTHIFDSLLKFLKPKAQILALVKPQFELEAKDLDKKGRVRNAKDFLKVENKIKDHILKLGLSLESYFVSELEGKDGNVEFFIFMTN